MEKDCWLNEANYSEKNNSQNQVFYSCLTSQQESQGIWYVDSGCSSHMTGNKEYFVKLEEQEIPPVKLGDGKFQNVEGRGVISVRTRSGKTRYISDVLYVPGLAQNLLSVGQLIRKGYSLHFEDGECTIYDKINKQLVAKVKMSGNFVFPLSMPSIENCAMSTNHIDEGKLWHLRYGHLNYRSLKVLKSKGMVIGIPNIDGGDKVCEGCILGKFHRLPFTKTSWRARRPLELVHADICGPTRTTSLNNRRYFLLFVDDYTRMMWVYILEQKSEAFTKFLEFKALAEKQSGHQLKVFRTDRGGEFTSKEFINYCKENGIKKELTVRYTPQQNGVAERKNRTIVEMARSMLKARKLPNTYWAEAVNTAVYILNRSPTKAVHNKTPYEGWHKKKPEVTSFRIFGCVAYSHIPSQHREKFDEKGEKLIFI